MKKIELASHHRTYPESSLVFTSIDCSLTFLRARPASADTMSHDSPPPPNHHAVGHERHLAARDESEASVAVLLAADPTIATMPADDDDNAAVPSSNSRKQTDKAAAAGSGGASGASKSQARKRGRKGPNKWVYITCLSEDTTEQELIELAARYGVLQPDLETGHPRVKLYRDESGKCKVRCMTCALTCSCAS